MINATLNARNPPLSLSDLAVVNNVLSLNGDDNETLINKFRIDMKRCHIRRLRPEVWLNDNVCKNKLKFFMILC